MAFLRPEMRRTGAWERAGLWVLCHASVTTALPTEPEGIPLAMSANDARDSNDSGSARAEDRPFLGHPPGLFPLFFTEMWERFSFYLMIALLALYLTKYLGYEEARASDVTTWYLSLVYFTPFLGGLIADRLIGYSRAILAGGLLMMAGHIVLALDHRGSNFLGIQNPFLFAALGLLIAGNGLFKPNISTLVGNLYAEGDCAATEDSPSSIWGSTSGPSSRRSRPTSCGRSPSPSCEMSPAFR